jgi:hypothetical protein
MIETNPVLRTDLHLVTQSLIFAAQENGWRNPKHSKILFSAGNHTKEAESVKTRYTLALAVMNRFAISVAPWPRSLNCLSRIYRFP